MTKKLAPHIILGISSIGVVAIPTATIVSYYVKEKTSSFSNISSTKEPVLDLNNINNLASNEAYKQYKLYFLDYLDYSFGTNKLNIFKESYKKSGLINGLNDFVFNKTVNSNGFEQLIKTNNKSYVINYFKELFNPWIFKYHDIISYQLNWDFGFSSLLTNSKINSDKYQELTNHFIGLYDQNNIKQKNARDLYELYDNEKFAWLMTKTNSNHEYQFSYYVNELSNAELLGYKNNYKEYQWLIYKAYDKENNIDKTTKEISGAPKKINPADIIESMDEWKYETEENLNANILRVIVNILSLDNIISINNDSIKNDVFIRNIRSVLWFISNIDEKKKEKLINIILKNKKEILLISRFILSIWDEYNKNTSDYKAFLKYLFDKGIIKKLINVVNDFTATNNSDKNIIIKWMSFVKRTITNITGRQFNTAKSIVASIYKIRLESILDLLNHFVIILNKSYSVVYGLENESLVKFSNNLSNIKNITSMITDVLWTASSFDRVNILFSTLLILINGWNESLSVVSSITHASLTIANSLLDIITSPFQGVIELSNFMKENKIPFSKWIVTHWDKCAEGRDWFMTFVMKIDVLNWFHSCIPMLIKEIF